MLADLDLLSALIGPTAYLFARHSLTHSILGTVVVILVAVALAHLFGKKRRPLPNAAAAKDNLLPAMLFAAALAGTLHVLMDVCTSAGVTLLWPWRATRFASDWLPGVDPWILALLLAGILLPELFGLVSSEIGGKSTAPRGRNGAIAALALVLIYAGARAMLHGNAVAQLDAHTYRGESPRRLAAFADPVLLMNWRGVVETSTQVCSINVPAMSTRFDPESGLCVHKPEDSISLQAAEGTESVKKFLQAARFPKASVGATEDGTEVAIRDARDVAEEEKRFTVTARVLLDRKGQVTSQEVRWSSEVHLR